MKAGDLYKNTKTNKLSTVLEIRGNQVVFRVIGSNRKFQLTEVQMTNMIKMPDEPPPLPASSSDFQQTSARLPTLPSFLRDQHD
jgi:hypothetical protein